MKCKGVKKVGYAEEQWEEIEGSRVANKVFR